jgi:sulfate adenylyltransferase
MTRPAQRLVTPYGGELIDLIVPAEEAVDLAEYAKTLPSIALSARTICDLELLAVGAFSPLDHFMTSADHERVLNEMRLADGHIFPMPVTLPTDDVSQIVAGREIALRDQRNNIVAVMKVDEIYESDPNEFAAKVLGTQDPAHPLVAESRSWGRFNLAGRPRVIALPKYYDFPELRLTPHQSRESLGRLAKTAVVAFQTRNPLHRAHEELVRCAMHDTGGALLLHPVVGMTRPGDIDHYTRVRTYRSLVSNCFGNDEVVLALLPLAMRFAGPREALWHALIRRNYGASHFIVGRDHASPGADSNGDPFYEPYAAQELVAEHADEIGMTVVPFREYSYDKASGKYREDGGTTISGTAVREEYLSKGRELPEWFTRPEIARILQDAYPAAERQGFCLWFTGLSAAGKSTIAEIVSAMLLRYGRQSTLLDGDLVRRHLSAGLGFDKAGRDENIRRIGFVASEIVRHNGVAICAAISPYRETREEIRKMFGQGRFIEVFVDTPLAVCEDRDPKGMYAKARRGDIKDFTGIDDAYEAPLHAEITLRTVSHEPDACARLVLEFLMARGSLGEAA